MRSLTNLVTRRFLVYKLHINDMHNVTQPAMTCSKLTIETVEQGLKYVQN